MPGGNQLIVTAHCRRIVLHQMLAQVVINTDTDVINPHQIGFIGDVIDKLIQSWLPFLSQKNREAHGPDHATIRGDCLDQLIRDIPPKLPSENS